MAFLVLNVRICPGIEKGFYNIEVTSDGGPYDDRSPTFIPCIGIDSGLKVRVDFIQASLQSGPEQTRS